MSRAAVEWAKKVRAGSAGAKHVLRALADYAGENGYCWPGITRLANETEQSVNTVRKRIVELMAAGLVHRFDRARTHGSPDTNGYILLIDEAAKAFAAEKGWKAPAARHVGAKPAAPVQTAFDFGAQEGPLQDVSWDSPEAIARANPDPGLAVESAAGLIPNPAVPVDNEADGRPPDWGRVVQPAEGGSSSLLDHKDPTFESLSDPSPPNPLRGNGRGDDPPDDKKDPWFEFEAVYPFDETEPRHPARKAFNRLGEADQKLAIAHAKRYRDDCLNRNRKICHAKTWLRDRGWEPFVALAAKAAALGRPVEMIWIAKGSSEWDAWDAYLVATRAGRLVAFQTRGRKGLGCWKETRFPPGAGPPRSGPPEAGSKPSTVH